jgi:4-hydroxybenzoate polyprenyltransferase
MNVSPATAWHRAKVFARMVRIEHSVFALPFAYIGLFLAAGGWPGLQPLLLLTIAMVAVRSWAMAVNRIADLEYDRRNPRTSNRPLITGDIDVRDTVWLCLLFAAIFVAVCAFFNQLCLLLAPVALAWSALYSLSKRFTWLSHFWLGSVLGLAPLGGWLAYEPAWSLAPALFFLGVTFWVAGFDILYACQDAEFDRRNGLQSLPSRFGIRAALSVSTLSHLATALLFLLAGLSAGLGGLYFAVWILVSAILVGEHALVSDRDLSRVDAAFFTANGAVAIVLWIGVLADLFL